MFKITSLPNRFLHPVTQKPEPGAGRENFMRFLHRDFDVPSGKMIVSALLTSVGINFGLCILFFTLYSVLRKQPGNYDVFIPRLLADGMSHQRTGFNLERLLPTPGWVRRAWKPSEEELLASSGLDAVVFMRIVIFWFASFESILWCWDYWVNCSGNQLENVDFANLTNDSLDVFSISNVNNGSKRNMDIYLQRELLIFIRQNLSHINLPFWFIVVPVSAGISVSDTVESFFTEFHPSTYLSHMVIRRTNKLQNLINDMKKQYERLIRLRTESNQPKFEHDGCCGLFRHKVNLVDQYEKKLEDLEENLRLGAIRGFIGRGIRAAFVSFKSRYGAAIALHMQQSNNPTQWVTEQAPEPRDVYWPFFSSTFMGRWISKLVVIFAYFDLTVLFLIPVVFVQGLANLAQLEVWFPALESILSLSFVSEIVTGYLPSLILLIFIRLVPPVMRFLSTFQGYICTSEIEKSACEKVLWFTIWNVFFGNVLSGSVLNQISVLLEPKNIPATLAVTVPAQASFFIAYVVTSGWTSISTELFRLIPFIWSLMRKPCLKSPDDEFEVPGLPYHKDIPRLLFFGLLGITYFFLAPLILPFLLIYFCLAYIIYRNQLINVYEPKYETAGQFWPTVHNSMIFSLLLMHAIALGIFTLKKVSLASTLLVPLPILTLLFNAYCRKRFLPIFVAYSTEALLNKDREDHNDPTMAEFFNQMATAYQDPALLPIQFSTNSDSHSAPLLASAEIRDSERISDQSQ
ncbi:hypothetical protein HYC85_021016 [Camellia sinensis]|uniref:CSC1/OSCA1-like 7TM region domain-containing protein n=1 Tax=Camellia sinensis TaxID=4442 RepID=A0A7J7GGF1_CAMSI|nr:hypothetical protein HYC85_021016 [Camellia sinensis]